MNNGSKIWAVGSSFGGTRDQTGKFLQNNEWVEGWGLSNNDRYKKILDLISVNDYLVMKSSATKGTNHSITFTRLKAIGKVIGKENYYTFMVNWLSTEKFPIDFDGIRYSKTIELLREDNLMTYVRQFILAFGSL